MERLRLQFNSTGLWPVILESLDGEPDRPWVLGEFDPSSSTSPDGVDVPETLRGWWSEAVPLDDEPEALEEVAPFGQEFPGLAQTPKDGVDEAAPDDVAASMTGRLGLVPASRPADVIATIGWQGPTNYFNEVGPFAAVLRTWEDRFGAEVVGIGFDTLTLGVRRPPSSNEEATAVAAEHYAACMDNISQGAGSIRAYAAHLKGARRWDFWWD